MESSTSERSRDFKCTLCPSSFRRKHDLTNHIRRHVKEKGFECNQCTYKTGRSSDLSRHVKAVHEKLTPFKCSYPGCNYKASNSSHVQRHRLTHETDPSVRRPFPCTFEGCEYRATEKASSGRHVQSRHNRNSEKRFECSMCSAAFDCESNLWIHINGIHVKETSYSCSHCEYKSWFASSVKNHMRKVHTDGTGVTQKKTAHQSAKSTLRRRQETNPNNGTKLTSSGESAPAPRPSGSKRKMKTAGGSEAEVVLGNLLSIFTCTLCSFMAYNEQQALEHSAFYNDHVLLPN